LDIAPINISLEGLARIIDSLRTNARNERLSFSGKPHNDLFDEEDDDNYLIPIPASSLLKVLKVNKSSLTDDDVELIINGLKLNSTVTGFYLENNPHLTVRSAQHLSELIQSTKTLKKVWFEGKPNVNDQWAIFIASALKVSQSKTKELQLKSINKLKRVQQRNNRWIAA
jgi:hypothetical protein